MANWMIVSLALLVAINLFATTKIARSPYASPSQRVVQIVLIWLLPVVGATIVLAFIAAERYSQPEPLSVESSLYAGDETTLASGPNPCGCSSNDGGGGGDD